MQKQLAAGIAAFCLLAGLPLTAQELPFSAQEPAENLVEMEPVIVVGGYATPKMWKVSKGDHVMWVLGDGGRAPAGVKWRVDQMEAHVAESQLVLYPGVSNVDVDVGFFKVISLVPVAYKAAKNPNGRKLKEVLPPETYARWRVLKTTYVGKDDDIEKWRPLIAIAMLEDKVGEKLGPLRPRQAAPSAPAPMGPPLRPLLEQAVKKFKVKDRTMRKVEREVKIKNARDIIKSLGDTNQMDVKCFASGLDYIERIIEFSKQKADPATTGSAQPPRREECGDVFMKGLRSGEIPDRAGVLKVIDELELQGKLGRQQLESEWIAAAQAAMAKNKSTFAVLPMYIARNPTGYLAKLRELGYSVEEPGSTGN